MRYSNELSFVIMIINFAFSIAKNDDHDFVKEYNIKICVNEPTCNLVTNPILDAASLTLSKRDCMCDSDCVEYGDCCNDSKYFGSKSKTEKQYYCPPAPGYDYYMVVNCASNYTDEDVKIKCSKATRPLEENDFAIPIPVTNAKTGVTYANAYCALCNHDTEFEKWTTTFGCADPPEGYFQRRNGDDGNTNSTAKPPGLNFFAYAAKVNQLLKLARYNATVKEIIANYEGKQLVCRINSSLPKLLNQSVRKCIPNLISECPNDKENVCKSYFQAVSDASTRKTYQNKDCAICNGVDPKNLTGCPTKVRTAASGLFSTSGKGSSDNDVCRNKQLTAKFC